VRSIVIPPDIFEQRLALAPSTDSVDMLSSRTMSAPAAAAISAAFERVDLALDLAGVRRAHSPLRSRHAAGGDDVVVPDEDSGAEIVAMVDRRRGARRSARQA
jgi:hypothetical protein